ncbi:MAG: D-alanyl-lipoteichoic acid biosynthesis protein DltD [Flavobacteriales bacterium]
MNLPGPYRAFHHAVALPIAVLASWLLLSSLPFFNGEASPFRGQDTLDYPLRGYLANFDGHPFLTDALAKTFADGSSIVLLGSSELTTSDHPSKPSSFFNDRLHVPLIAIGHADNQSFSMFSQLLSAGGDLANARLAILVSPSWFVGNSGERGTNLASFLEYEPSPSLYRIQRRVQEKDSLATPIAGYLSDHRTELGSAQPVARWLAHEGSWRTRLLYFFSQPWNAEIIRRTSPEMRQEQPVRKWTPSARQDIKADQWEPLYAAGITEHLAQCTNNSVYVNDAYYSENINGRTREIEAYPVGKSREERDFQLLLNYVKAKHGRPFFIIQPLNPFVYTNLKEVTPTIAWIRDELDRRDMPYLDLWVDDTARFQPGALTDVMHLGPLGWYRVDSAMNAYFR